MDELISVVIPVYKVEKYLDRCLESVVTQTHKNLEILLIDDGSPDRCPQMCDQWAERDSRIRVIHKENAGLGMARNTGMEQANGQYICFFDSDDFVAKDILETALAMAIRTDAEITFFGMATANEKNVIINNPIPHAQKEVYCGNAVRDQFLPDMIHSAPKEATIHNVRLSVCSCLFSMDLLKRTGWSFVSERKIISEDSYALLSLFQHVQRVAVLPKVGYYYFENPASLTRRYREDRYEQIRHFYMETVSLSRKIGYSGTVEERLGRLFLALSIGALKQMAASRESMANRIKNVKKTVNDPLMQNILRGLDIGCYPWKIRILFSLMRSKCCAMVLGAVWLQNAARM